MKNKQPRTKKTEMEAVENRMLQIRKTVEHFGELPSLKLAMKRLMKRYSRLYIQTRGI